MLSGIVLDHDGTIVNSKPRQEHWMEHWADVNGVEWRFEDSESFWEFYNKTIDEKGPQALYDSLGLPCDMNDPNHRVWPAYEQFKMEHPAPLYEGIASAIKEIWELGSLGDDPLVNRRIRLAVNTTNSWGSTRVDLLQGGILSYIDAMVTYDTLNLFQGAGNPGAVLKPSPVSLALTLDLLDLPYGSEVLHIGDTLGDLKASCNIIRMGSPQPEGLITVGACWGFEGREVLEKGVEKDYGALRFNYLADKPEELVQIVRELID